MAAPCFCIISLKEIASGLHGLTFFSFPRFIALAQRKPALPAEMPLAQQILQKSSTISNLNRKIITRK
jgi:hypothetical protein